MSPLGNEHKQQLHQRILERRSQLEANLRRLQANEETAASERLRAVDGALAELKTHSSGSDWSAVGESEAAALSRWLDQTRFLIEGDSTPAPKKEEQLSATAQAQVQQLEAQLGLWGATLEGLIVKAQAAGTQLQSGDRERITALKNHLDVAKAKVAEVKVKALEWESYKHSTAKVWEDIDLAFKGGKP